MGQGYISLFLLWISWIQYKLWRRYSENFKKFLEVSDDLRFKVCSLSLLFCKKKYLDFAARIWKTFRVVNLRCTNYTYTNTRWHFPHVQFDLSTRHLNTDGWMQSYCIKVGNKCYPLNFISFFWHWLQWQRITSKFL